MRIFGLAVVTAAVLAATGAQAQDACRYWSQQSQAANTALMQQIAGVWASQEPDGAGGMADIQTQYGPDGSIQSDKRACYSMPGLGTSCPVTSSFGMWVAHYSNGQGGSFFVATNMRTTLSNGQNMQGCGGYTATFSDPNTLVGQNGQVIARRVR